MNYKKEDIVKHWGIWIKNLNQWFVDDSGIIFAVTCPRVAEVQLEITSSQIDGFTLFNREDLEVREVKP